MPVTKQDKDGISYCTATNSAGTKLTLISVGATITELVLPSGVDVVLGYKDVNDYRTNHFYLGCSVGRVANRIRGAQFCLDEETYLVSANIPPNTLHGGKVGFNQANWDVTELGEQSVTMKLVSPSGDQGYPGCLETTVVYTLTDSNEVIIQYSATLSPGNDDQSTIVNLTNHTYFNLGGKGTILDHRLTVNSEAYHPLDKNLVPLGPTATVKGTPLDFTTATRIGERIEEAGGYDINYNMADNQNSYPKDPSLKHFATLEGLCTLRVYSDQPGVQLYTGNFLDGEQSGPGKDGRPLIKHGGVCLETQAWPNAINIPGAEGQVILRPGQAYNSKTVWEFL